MKYLVFYRSREDSAQLASSAKIYFDRHVIDGLSVDIINLEKRNYSKYLATLAESDTLPDVVYLWHDEEILHEFISEKYPTIKILHYNGPFVSKNGPNYYDKRLESQIVREYKQGLVPATYYTIDYNLRINEVSINTCDKQSNLIYYDTKKEADEAVIKKINTKIENCDKSIESYKHSIDACQSEKKRLEAMLKRRKKK